MISAKVIELLNTPAAFPVMTCVFAVLGTLAVNFSKHAANVLVHLHNEEMSANCPPYWGKAFTVVLLLILLSTMLAQLGFYLMGVYKLPLILGAGICYVGVCLIVSLLLYVIAENRRSSA